jgi:Ca-activated chloride channel homolog
MRQVVVRPQTSSLGPFAIVIGALLLLFLAGCGPSEQTTAEQAPAPASAPPPAVSPSAEMASVTPQPPVAAPARRPQQAFDPSTLLKDLPRARGQAEPQHGAPSQSGPIRLNVDRGGMMAPPPARQQPSTFPGVDRFPDARPEPVRAVAEQPVSTFAVDVDTASYAVARRYLRDGRVPPRDAVRVEEMVNYFRYDYAAAEDRSRPFGTTVSVFPTPWNADTRLLHIGIRGYDVTRGERPRLNLVLLLDVSGSMQPDDRLPLLQRAFARFVEELRDDDRVAIVTYANNVHVPLEPTAGRERDRITHAIAALRAGGGTAGGDGLQRAYTLAERHFDREAVNRVILATDGDFNVGISDPRQLETFIAGKRKTGIYLSVLGVGVGNLNDALMQRLAQAGNGNAAYVDSMIEARKVLVEELSSTMFPIANDAKIQVEFNPATVAEYRLIGYETRLLRREDFNDDRVDAGDIGAGHTVTALYEITPVDSKARLVDPLRYGTPGAAVPSGAAGEYAFVRLRYKLPGEPASRLIETPVRVADALAALGAAPDDARFATAVAAFGQKLRGEARVDAFAYRDIAALANAAKGSDPLGVRAELVQLVRAADGLR